MAKYRSVNTKFWDDSYIVSLTSNEKLVYLYLITNPLTNVAGCYEVTLRRVSFDTGISESSVSKVFDRLSSDRKIIHRDGWIVILNFIKNQMNNPSILKGIAETVKGVPQWIQSLLLQPGNSLVTESDTDSHLNLNLNLNSNSNSKGKEEKEGEQAPPKNKRKGLCEIPENFEVPQKEIEKLISECPTVQIGLETENFIDHFLGNGEKGKDWTAKWRKWIRTQHKWNLEKGLKAGPPKPPPKGDMLSPDYQMEPKKLTFDFGMLGQPDTLTLEQYDGIKELWRTRHPDQIHEIDEYERSWEFRERFGEAVETNARGRSPPGRGNGNGQQETTLPVPR